MNRAYSVLDIKGIDEEKRIIRGTATTPETDRVGDIVEPLGVKFRNPLPLLLHHRSDSPVGTVRFDKPTKAGVTFEAKLPHIEEPGALKDRVDEAWQSVKAGLIRGVSIGFRVVDNAVERIETGLRYLQTEVLELSLVVVPANAGARIEEIKSIDRALRAATGHSESTVVRLSQPGASGNPNPRQPQEGTKMKTIAEQIAEWEAKRAAKAARQNEIMTKAADEGRTLDTAEKEEHDTARDELKEIDEHLVRLGDLQKTMQAKAKPAKGDTPEQASESREGRVQVLTPKLEKGIGFARYMLCLANARLTNRSPFDIAKQEYPDFAPLHRVLKGVGGTVDPKHMRAAKELHLFEKAVAAGTTANSDWASALVEYEVMQDGFIEYLTPETIIGKFGTNGIPALNRVPFNIKVPRQTTLPSAYWVGEAKPKPLTKFNTDSVTLDFHKVATISAISEELARFSRPGADALVRDQLAKAVIRRIDIDFIDPNKGASAGVSPASITNGVTPIVSSGDTADNVRTDVKAAMAEFIQANMSLSNAVWIMNANVALSLSMIVSDLEQPVFPGLSRSGGTFLGLPVIVSQYVPTAIVVLVAADEVYLADDGNVSIDISREASLEMLDSGLSQDGTNGTGASLVSLWQTNMIGIRAEREITWLKRRSDAVQYISSANWGGTTGSGDI